MKKVAVIVRAQDADQSVKDLRKLGLLHVEHQQIPQGKDINALQEELNLVNSCLKILQKNELNKNPDFRQEDINTDWRLQAKHLIDLEKRYEQLELFAQKLKVNIAEWKDWGDFEPQKIEELSQKGIYVFLYQLPIKQINVFPKEAVVKIISASAGIANTIVFSRAKFEVPFKKIALPKQSLSHMQKRLAEDSRLMQTLKDEISQMFRFGQAFLKIKQGLEKDLEMQRAINGMAQLGALSYIMGFVPNGQIDKLKQEARIKQWGIVIQQPLDTDNVPVLLQNPRWVALINPLLRLLEVLPGYRELDVSLPFFLFLSLFFGILIGDVGYGIIYCVLTFWAHNKFRSKLKDGTVFFLLYVLSFCAITWGFLTGSFFGQSWCAKLGLKPIAPALNDSKIMQSLCFFLGALHLSIAHGWKAVLKAPSLTALQDVGWIAVLWSAFFFARMLILGEALPGFVMNMLFIGIALVILFTNPQRNMFKGVGEGLGAVALSLMNNFTDVVSYVRLFAVGMAGLAIAETTNSMAGAIGAEGVFSVIARSAILIVGHSLNIILGPISVLVHGVRLNVLEFSGHASITWSGVAYKPLKE